jgi:hypothetical protein
MLNWNTYWLKPYDQPPPKTYMYLPSETAAAFERGKNNLAESMVHLLFYGV